MIDYSKNNVYKGTCILQIMKKRIVLLLFALILPTILGQSAYTPLIIEPVSVCNYDEPVSYYAGLPSSPFRGTRITGTVQPQSQYYNTLPPLPTQGGFTIKSTCDTNTAELLMGVCGAPIGFPGLGGIASVNPSIALPSTTYGIPVCVNSETGSFLAYTYGMPSVLEGSDSFGNPVITANQVTTSTSSTITLLSYSPSSLALYLAGPLPTGTPLGMVACAPNTLCTTTITVPRVMDISANYVATVYQAYLQDANFMRALPVTVN